MSGSGDTPLRTDDDDWFGESRTPRASSDDDWTAAGPVRDPRRDTRTTPRDRRRTIVLAIVALVALVAAGIILAFVFTGGKKHPATPPVTIPTTTHAATTTKKPAGPTPAAPTVTLKPGDKGVQVKRLQHFLRLFGYSTAKKDDGVYGPATTAAVKKFQTATNLTADGIAGPATLRAIKAALGSKH